MRTPVADTDNSCEVAVAQKKPRWEDLPGSAQDSTQVGRQGGTEIEQASIVIIEPRALVRECLTRCISSIWAQKVVSFASLEDWLERAGGATASVVLYCSTHDDETGSDPDGARVAQLMKRMPVVVLSESEDLDDILDAIDRGARGYIPTSLDLAVVIEALRLVKAGGVFVPAGSVMTALRSTDNTVANSGPRKLFTARQAAVVEAIGKGKANKLIAHELNMCESTVKVHVRRIMKKLRAKNRTEVALIANGLLKSSGERTLIAE
jgi:DNA-binding NarL/FixJ family response regulator